MYCFEIYTIFTLFLVFVAGDEHFEKKDNISRGNETESGIEGLTVRSKNNSTSRRNPKLLSNFWMNVWGPLQNDLFAAQAIIIKEEDFNPKCGRGDRSKRRHLMCAGSILSNNLVLTSATCLHTATHIRHNIRGTLAVAISPVKATMEIIRVAEYRIHDDHNSWPSSPTFVKNNVAILKLACSIGKANFHKIVLPRTPFLETCSTNHCLVTVYGRMRETNWVMYQMYAPNTTLPDRRKKAAIMKDDGTRKIDEYKLKKIAYYGKRRSKRRLAGPPSFWSSYEPQVTKKSNDFSTNFSIKSTSENSLIERKATIPSKGKNPSFVKAISLEDDDLMDYPKSIGTETFRTIVPRSLNQRFGCAHTGAPIMLEATQYAIAVLPCDDRQPGAKWGYADLYDNLDWIDGVFQEWSTHEKISPSEQRAPEVPRPDHNGKTCSTCIFNFFIDLGCKDKNRCGNKTMSVHTEKAQDYQRAGDPIVFNGSKSCAGSKGLGIDVGISRGCSKKNQKLPKNSNNRKNWAKSYNSQIPASGESTNSREPSNPNSSKLTQPANVESSKMSLIKDPPGDKDFLSRKNHPPISEIPTDYLKDSRAPSTRYNVPRSDDKKIEKASNEIGLQNIEGHSNYWISEHQNPFGITSDAKRRLIESARSP